MGRGDWETGRRGEWETGRRGEWETGRVGDGESGRRNLSGQVLRSRPSIRLRLLRANGVGKGINPSNPVSQGGIGCVISV